MHVKNRNSERRGEAGIPLLFVLALHMMCNIIVSTVAVAELGLQECGD